MSNVQEALKAAIKSLTDSLPDWECEHGFKQNECNNLSCEVRQHYESIELCKSVLSEIDKCYGGTTPVSEPVAWIVSDGFSKTLVTDKEHLKTAQRFNWEIIPLYDKPQPRECEPVAEAIRERDRLGFAVVNVIGKLDEIIENTQEVEIDDFLHIAVPVDMWNELQESLEDMPKRADLYTSPQPRECEPVGELILDPVFLPALKAPLVNWKINLVDLEVGTKLYTSPQPRDWVDINHDTGLKLYKKHGIEPNDSELNKFISEYVETLKQLNTKG